MATLLERVGGEAAVHATCNKFYEIMVADARVNEFFKGKDIPKQADSLAKFLILAMGGPNNYTGKDMKTVHANLGIGEAEFNATCENLVTALKALEVKPEVIEEIKAVAASVKGDIVTK